MALIFWMFSLINGAKKKEEEMLNVWYTDVILKRAPESKNGSRSIMERTIFNALEKDASLRDMEKIKVECSPTSGELIDDPPAGGEAEADDDGSAHKKKKKKKQKREMRMDCTLVVPQKISDNMSNIMFMIPNHKPNIEVKGLETRDSIPYIRARKKKKSCDDNGTCAASDNKIIIEEEEREGETREATGRRGRQPQNDTKVVESDEETKSEGLIEEDDDFEDQSTTKKKPLISREEKVEETTKSEQKTSKHTHEILIEDVEEMESDPPVFMKEGRKKDASKTLTQEEKDVIDEKEYQNWLYHENDDMSALDPDECTGMKAMREPILDPKNMDQATIDASRAFVDKKDQQKKDGTGPKDLESVLDEMLAFFDDIDERRRIEREQRDKEREEQIRKERQEKEDRLYEKVHD